MVTWELAESEGRTRLTLVHCRFGPERTNEDYQLGWLAFLVHIKNLVEAGAIWQKPEVAAADYTAA